MDSLSDLINYFNQLNIDDPHINSETTFRYLVKLKNSLAQLSGENEDIIIIDQLATLQRKISHLEEKFEQSYSQQLNPSNFNQFPCYSSYFQQICDEIGLISHYRTNIQQIYFIGCGSLPISAVFWNSVTSLPVQGVDYNQSALNYASRLLTQLGLSSSQVQLVNQDGDNLWYQPDSLVILANMVERLETVVAKINQSGVKYLILRKTSGLRGIYYPPHCLDFMSKYPYQLVTQTDPVKGKYISTSLLYVRLN